MSPSASFDNSISSQLETFMQSLLDNVKKLERKISALEKSNDFKANRIKELDKEINSYVPFTKKVELSD